MFTNRTSKTTIQKITAWTLVLGFVFALFVPQMPVFAQDEKWAVVTASSGLNLRSGPSLDQKILQVLSQGQQVQILDISQDGLWAQVMTQAKVTGWVYKQYLLVVEEGNGKVLLDALNLRVGPGFAYHSLRLLSKDTQLTVLGRSTHSDWLLVQLPDGTKGWAFQAYILTSVEIASLPVAEASGGPYTSTGQSAQPSGPLAIVTIRDNQAVVDLSGLPASTDVVASLGLPGKTPDLKVASGSTNAGGNARLTFPMPAKWSDGSLLTQQELVLSVKATASGFSLSVRIIYLHG